LRIVTLLLAVNDVAVCYGWLETENIAGGSTRKAEQNVSTVSIVSLFSSVAILTTPDVTWVAADLVVEFISETGVKL